MKGDKLTLKISIKNFRQLAYQEVVNSIYNKHWKRKYANLHKKGIFCPTNETLDDSFV